MIKKFVKYCMLFSFLSLIFTYILVFAGKNLKNEGKYYSLSEKTKYLIFGNSRPECAFNDSLIDNSKNFSRSGEAYFYTYFKLKKLVESNKHIKNILLEFSNNQLLSEMDNWVWDDEHLNSRYPSYSRFMDYEAYKVLLSHNPLGVLKCEPLRMQKNFSFIFSHDDNFTKEYHNWGGYLFNTRFKTDSLLSAMKDNHKTISNQTISEINLRYLLKIIQICKDHDVEICLIRSPLHPKAPIENENEFKRILDTKLKEIVFLDFKDFPLVNNQYADPEHLNYKGASEFSLFIDQLIDEGLFHANEKQEMINTSIKKRLAQVVF